MPDIHYTNDKLAQLYDLDSPWSEDRDFYLSLAGSSPMKILDLGCGTGLLCNAYAELGHEVTGVDPSLAMLDVARRKPHGKRIEWVRSNAQNFQSEKRFDLIIMTGHAFQVLLDDADVLATFKAMREHLRTDGTIVFESRNPEIDWPSRWNYDIELSLPDKIVRESRRFISMQNDRMTFELVYEFPDERLVSHSQLRFMSRTEIEERLLHSNLRADVLFGDWSELPFSEQSSEEMIFVVK